MSLEGSIRNRVDRDLRALADLHVRHVRLVHFDFSLDDAHVRELEEHGAGVVHRADHGGLALLDVAPRDNAFDGRLHAHFAQVVPRAFERRLLHVDAAFLRLDLLLALLHVRLGDLHVVHGLLERLARRQLLLPEILLTGEVLLRLQELRLRRLNRLLDLIDGGLSSLERGRAAFNAPLEQLRVDLQEELADLHAIALVHREVDDAARRLRADLDQPFRLNLSGRRDDRVEIAGADHIGRDRQPFVLLEIEVRADDRAGDDEDSQCDENVLARHLRS